MRPRKKRDYASSHIVKGSERKVWKETETVTIFIKIRFFVSRGGGGDKAAKSEWEKDMSRFHNARGGLF